MGSWNTARRLFIDFKISKLLLLKILTIYLLLRSRYQHKPQEVAIFLVWFKTWNATEKAYFFKISKIYAGQTLL